MAMTDETLGALRRAVHHAEEFLASLDQRPVGATASADELRARLDVGLAARGVDPRRVIDELVAATAGGLHASAGGRFFAWVMGGAVPSALAADWLTSAWDQNAALYAVSPAAAVVEEVAGAWLKDLLGLPAEASFAFTTGCQLAHFTGLAAARYRLLRNVGWDVNEAGLCGAPRVRVLASECRHATVDRAVRYLGLGARSLAELRTDTEGCVDADDLSAELGRGGGPAIVVLDAADLNVGAFDSFAALVPIAKAAGAWVHVDGAFGLFARASRAKRHLAAGIDAADSWATDGHKWLNLPFDCGMAFVRDRDAHRAALTISAAYVAAEGAARDEVDWNPEWSRRSRGFAVYAALRELGREGVEDLIDRTCAHAERLVSGMGSLPGVEVLWQPRLNQGLVRFRDLRPGACESDHDARTDATIRAINATGEAFFSGTTWRGKRAMRVSVVNWRTSDADVARTVAAVARVLG
jgi:aromatic-L-amino-acid decarboxylase